jgi:tRNA-dihydrouridine synthase B
MARKHIAWYSRGLPGSAEFRSRVNTVETPAEAEALMDAFYLPLIERGVEAVRESFREAA